MKARRAHFSALTGVVLMVLPAMAFGQNYYDDDIYTNAPRQKKEKPAETRVYSGNGVTVSSSNVYTPSVTVEFPGADTYYVNTGNTRDVDEYNRRGQFLVADTVFTDTLGLGVETDQFAVTRRLQKFHNSDVVNVLDDQAYVSYVSSDPTVINIYVDNDPWIGYTPYTSWSWRWRYGLPWYTPSWAWYDPWYYTSWGWYDPWYYGGWGWYDPCYAWGWGPSWGHGWGHSWHPGPGWGHPGHGPGHGIASRPNSSVGSSRPHNYATANAGNVRPVTSSANRVQAVNNGRPGNSGYGSGSMSNRYGSAGSVVAGNGGNSGNYGTVSGTRGRNGSAGASTANRSNVSGNRNVSTSAPVSNNRVGSTSAPASTQRQSSTRSSSSSSTRSSSSSSTRSSSSSSTRSSSSSSSSRGSSYSSGSHGGGYSGGGGSRGGGGGGGSRGGGGGRGR